MHSKGAANAIAAFRQRGMVVFGEPIAAGLSLDGRNYYSENYDEAAKIILSLGHFEIFKIFF